MIQWEYVLGKKTSVAPGYFCRSVGNFRVPTLVVLASE